MKRVSNKIKVMFAVLTLGLLPFAVACTKEADKVSDNLSNAADNFEIMRRIIFINGITDKVLLLIEGRCSLGNNDKTRELSVTCKIGDDKYIKDFVGLSDNVTYTVEQLEPAAADPYHYRMTIMPESIIPDIDVR